MSNLGNTSAKSILARFAIGKGLPGGARVSVAPTRNGIIFMGMLFVLLLGSINHNNNLGFIITFLLGGMLAVSFIHTWRNLLAVLPVSIRAVPVFAGQPASFELVLEAANHSGYDLDINFPNGETTHGQVERQGRKTLTVFLQTARRGLLVPQFIEISTSYPLGMLKIRKSFAVKGSCLVYPKPAAGSLVSAKGEGDERSEGESGGAGVDDFEGLAAYQQGDSLRHIFWKAYSRGQGLHSKKFEGLRGRTLFFNPDALPGRDYEHKLARICFMVLKAENLRLPYGLQLGKLVIAPGLGGSHKLRCLRELALVKG